jgi:repressor LexA
MNDPLTPLERRVYHYLLDFLAENTYQPSVREIGRRFRIKSTKTVAELLQALERKGFIERQAGRSRGVRIVGFGAMGGVQPVPLYARRRPGTPFLSEENRERFVAVDRAFVPSPDVFYLRHAGDALVGRAVLDGDWVLVSPSSRARDGDLVAVRIGADVVVRAVSHLGAVVSLSPSGPDEPETFLGPADDFTVLGVVAGVFRPFHDHSGEEGNEAPPTTE